MLCNIHNTNGIVRNSCNILDHTVCSVNDASDGSIAQSAHLTLFNFEKICRVVVHIREFSSVFPVKQPYRNHCISQIRAFPSKKHFLFLAAHPVHSSLLYPSRAPSRHAFFKLSRACVRATLRPLKFHGLLLFRCSFGRFFALRFANAVFPNTDIFICLLFNFFLMGSPCAIPLNTDTVSSMLAYVPIFDFAIFQFFDFSKSST
ncbi:hypothetical protein TPHA_0K01830 [Tetrapisispora phaffii CBS 4417]|uniref:Uncharacterized protein n=1 Tax=Tetrapisispora phaffii (strain ATCC 24235 / CBS 4417 / NBRC 1672 / NRRL Y-8282 / UCD 70-5) TaxID=1071381 RepID=G8BZI7_TETPH|nr:hypothetical protein TPHA_0K01830 [Tetrapisispora phaffii CBS 4417]CCE65315.1 hypothetical protein TPHA_0K01830 [Tetrapisispora phaffii CBS 4417]